ncbi:MAG: type II toxin-antitoxin system HipA family toxin [Pseudomonadota bacterium]
MSTAAEVRLWGRTIGAVSLRKGDRTAEFEYDTAFANSGIQVAPIRMPLSRRLYRFPELSTAAFHGLPGLLADSLPDAFGQALINQWLATQGRKPDSMNAIERLCYTGTRGMGALEFRPAIAIGDDDRTARALEIDRLVELASTVLQRRNELNTTLADETQAEALRDILRVGTSAGGARAKAVIAWNPQTQEVRSGQIQAGDGFEHWLLKFDGVRGNRDKELDDPQGYGAIEYAYSLMARDCGIEMSECRLLEENGRRHFMTRRFDRTADGEKIHMQSLAALGHFDFNRAGAYSYEQAFLLMRELDLPMQAIEQQFRRMTFNIIARNQDDHTKNIAFLMNKRGEWSLAPAFDMTYSYNPSGDWTARHQMSLNGKRDDFDLDDFKACARTISLKRGQAETVVEAVQAVVDRWPDYAARADIPEPTALAIKRKLRSILN